MSASKRNHRSFSETVLFMLSLTVPHLEPASSSAAHLSCEDPLAQNEVIFPPVVSEHQNSHNSPLMGIEECANDAFYKFLIHIECE